VHQLPLQQHLAQAKLGVQAQHQLLRSLLQLLLQEAQQLIQIDLQDPRGLWAPTEPLLAALLTACCLHQLCQPSPVLQLLLLPLALLHVLLLAPHLLLLRLLALLHQAYQQRHT
jgi:hypothetical protein